MSSENSPADDTAYDPEISYSVSSPAEPVDEQTTETPAVPQSEATQESSLETSEAQANEEQDDDDDDDEGYDINAGLSDDIISTAATTEGVSTETKQVSETNDDDDDEDEYDPTSEFPEISKDDDKKVTTESSSSHSAVSTTTSSIPAISNQTTNSIATSASGANVDPTIAQQLSQRLFSDPEFLKLSPADQQKKVIEEFSKISQSPSQAPPQSQYNGPSPELGAHRPNIEIPLNAQERADYNTFLDNESKYHSRYPFKPNSRLFVGNLPANFSKENLYRIFSVYGNLCQVSLKNTYAFLQYDAPEPVERAIEKEYGIPLYGKDLVLEIAKNSRPETQQPRHQPNTFFESRKREREDNDPRYSRSTSSSSSSKKTRGSAECQIFVKQSAEPQYARETARTIENAGIITNMEFLRPSQSLDKKIKEAAYSGVIGVVLINRNRTVDCSIYQKTPDGGIRFDEYNSINNHDVVKLISIEKEKQARSSVRSPNFNQPQVPSYNSGYNNSYQQPAINTPVAAPQANLLQTLQNLPPQQLQALLALTGQAAAPAPIPVQQQYTQPANTGVDLASLLGKLQPQAAPPAPAPQYGGSSYQPQQYGGRYGQAQSPPPPPPAQQQQPPQGNNGAQGGDIQSLLANLAKFQ